MKVTILALTLNEIDGVSVILPQIKKNWYHQLIVVDGGSTDGTIEWCKKNNYQIIVQRKKGIRNGYLESMPHVTGDVILSLSPDGNCDPCKIPELIEKIKKNDLDLVIGSRYLGGKKSEDDDIVTAFGNWFFTKTVNILFDSNLTDIMVIYRIFRKELIEDLEINSEEPYLFVEKFFFTNISWEPLMSVRAVKKKKKICEIYAGEPPRIGGERKLQIIRWGAAYYFQFLREFFKWKK